jgi:class 3 adenylate cyclase
MVEFRQHFQEETTRTNKAFVVVDVNNSTRMKQIEPEQSWVTKTLRLYGVIAANIESAGGRVIKFVGDGILGAFDEDNAVSAVNAGISIQESLKKQREEGITDITVSVAIAYGSAVEFKIIDERDYIGQTVDRAYRLCSAANANAVFIDSQIIDAAPMTKVSSVVGRALGRSPEQYRGTAQKVSLKGFSSPVSYYEIWWDRDHYGVDSKFVSDQSVGGAGLAGAVSSTVTAATDQPRNLPSVGRQSETERWARGYVKSIGEKFGFITSEGTDYFFTPWFVFRDDFRLTRGSRVVFV